MNFKKGDIVRFVNEEGEGKILSISGIKVLVETNDGFEMEYSINSIVPTKSIDDYKVENDDSKDLSSSFDKKVVELDKKFNHKKAKSVEVLEIDLHIENLIDSHKGMQNYQILEVQMANFRRSINIALSRRLKKLVVIHGVGVGVLRDEIRKELQAFYPNFEFYDASYQEYGYGATEIELKYNY